MASPQHSFRSLQVLKPLTIEDCSRIRSAMSEGGQITAALKSVGPVCLGDGIWRLFSDSCPPCGIDAWNTASVWRAAWGITAAEFHTFGEDLFGNQLITLPGSGNAYLWNHENGDPYDLLLEPVELFEVVVESGLDWIDFYGEGVLAVARNRIKDVSIEQHLHWTTPLILGGQTTVENTSVVERTSHLVGHAKLWQQVGELPPGQVSIVFGYIWSTIWSFEHNRLPFHATVSDLDAAINALPDTYTQKKALLAEWWTLEQVNAVMLERNETELPEEHVPLVQDAIRTMKQTLLGTALES